MVRFRPGQSAIMSPFLCEGKLSVLLDIDSFYICFIYLCVYIYLYIIFIFSLCYIIYL